MTLSAEVPSLAQLAPWDAASQPLLCVGVEVETADVRTFRFRARTPPGRQAWFGFQPGQFLTLRVPLPEGEAQRCYTVSSSPARPYEVAITVKAIPSGRVSGWLHDNLKPGDSLGAAGGIAGVFSHLRHRAARYLFLSAGSGITPLMSMTRWLSDSAGEAEVVFLHAARTPADVIFRRELETLASRHPWLKLVFVVESVPAGQAWAGPTGRLSRALLELSVPDLREREVFCCGPAPFMQAARGLAAELGHDPGRYHEESFTPEAAPLVSAGAGGLAGAGPLVTFSASGRSLAAEPGEMLLSTAARAGIVLPSACQMGVCGTCRVRCSEGRVEMRDSGGLMPDEIAEGYILACCSTPLEPVTLEA